MTNSDGYAKLSEDRCAVKIYPEESVAEQWKDEAEEQELSLSRYLQNLIHEARSYRQHGLVHQDGSQKRIQELEQQIGQLQKRLEEKESESSEAVSFDPETLKQEVLTGQYQSLEEILRRIVETGILDDVIRVPVENQLYFLAAQNEVEYERGWGWKLTGNEVSQ
ncbi:hypothetical protein OB919_16155 [Halobacteria archaeon AArc-curdl1]|uniref:Uncharacterized protein n=1 Tax=Natronosalvus hydrolyticus TaxID=2979988 RepID=A0AAP2ZCT9_9EURY|nr:hypothetical protein [Halobacteria archaeon AArc-curdl1]